MKKYIFCFILLLGILSFTMIGVAEDYVPGSEEDPIITLSYLQLKIDEMKAYVDSKVGSGTPVDGGETAPVEAATTFEVLKLEAGQSLIGGESAEIIVRSGKVSAIDNGVNGISDVTVGKDLRSEAPVEWNHLILVPRNDGRGIFAVEESWVMVKGAYEIIN